uniref:Alpha/beta fold hydrolase n=1 Tax=Janibacter limosus TaxID=53458 RepID=A0AC61U2Z9_9MICO|nr:alpha/beta fold hydrolase [Janibacter limosus]
MRYYSRDGLTFDVDDSGPEGADLVVLLHGWPQDRTAWDKVTPLLTTTGVRVIAPDLRGYSPGARPGNHLDYEITEMVADVVALLDEVGAEQAHIVGHDWGGALARAIAARAPERVATLTVLSTPSPSAMAKGVRSGDQLKHSWYMALFALPVLPVLFFRLFAQQILEKIGMPRERAAHDARRLKSPGAAEGTFARYRAALSPTLIWRKRRAKGVPAAACTAGSSPPPSSGAARTRPLPRCRRTTRSSSCVGEPATGPSWRSPASCTPGTG